MNKRIAPFAPSTAGNRRRTAWSTGLGLAGLLLPAAAQDYFPSVNPFTVPTDPTLTDSERLAATTRELGIEPIGGRVGSGLSNYNIKMGPVLAWFRAGVIFRYQSNYNLVSSDNSSGEDGNFSIGPALTASLRYDISEKAHLIVSMGLTYQWSLSNNSDHLVFSPASSINYQFEIGDVTFSIFDSVTTASTATLDPTISGTGSSSITDFNRLGNNVGLGASWQPFKDTQVAAGYSFGISRGLANDNYNQLDRNSQNFNLSIQETLNPVWTVGLSAQGNINNYLPSQVVVDDNGQPARQDVRVQNDNYGWGVGPTVGYRLSQFITVSGAVNYTVQNYQQTGLITDTSNFDGMTFNVSLSHIINQALEQTISASRSVRPGNGSNYTQFLSLAYQLNWQMTQIAALSLSFRFNDFEQSGPGYAYVPFDEVGSDLPEGSYITDDGVVAIPLDSGQKGQQYVLNLGTGFDLTQKLSLSLNYSIVMKRLDNNYQVTTDGGDVPYGDYLTQSIVLALAYKF